MKFRLGAVLRARKAQEDAAKAALVKARGEADVAAVRVQARRTEIDERHVTPGASASAFAAAMTARQALAAELSVAIGAAQLADGQVDERIADLTDAAVQRRTLEKLEERHALTRRRSAEAADQKSVDDLTTSAHSRRDTDADDPTAS